MQTRETYFKGLPKASNAIAERLLRLALEVALHT